MASLVTKRINIFAPPWDVSSVGLEHRLDRAGVVGSTPSHPTEHFLIINGNQVKPPLLAVFLLQIVTSK
jgi:hypothetical protein